MKQGLGDAVRGTICVIIVGGNREFTVLKIPKHSPLVPVVRLSRLETRKPKALGSEAGSVVLGVCSRGTELSIWLGF
jgi:hypothetical protein